MHVSEKKLHGRSTEFSEKFQGFFNKVSEGFPESLGKNECNVNMRGAFRSATEGLGGFQGKF